MENKNQPAFAFTTFSIIDKEVPVRYDGLSKRELIAAMCLHGLLAYGSNKTGKHVTTTAVEFADELLKKLGQ